MWKHPKCLSTDKWINSVMYTYNGLLLSLNKRKLCKCDNIDNLEDMLRGISQVWKEKYCMIPFIAYT